MKKALLTSIATLALSASAFAADLPVRGPADAPAPIFVGMNWTGFYAGVQAGYAQNNSRWTNVPGAIPFAFNNNGDGFLGGAHIGYNQQFGNFVLGLEGELNAVSLKGSGLCAGAAGTTCNTRQDWLGSVRARAGFAFDRALVYATGGVAFSQYKFNQSVPAVQNWGGGNRTGWTAGLGIDYALTNNWIMGAQYSYYDFGTKTGNGGTGPVSIRFRENEHVVTLRLSYKFGGPAAAVVAKY